MTTRKRKPLFSGVLLVIILFLVTAQTAFAANAHSQLITTVSEQGGYQSFTTPNLNANWNSTNHQFVLKTLWTITDNNYSWVETGFMDGDLNGSNYHGFYTAYGVKNSSGTLTSYSEYSVSGFSTTVGQTHNYEVQYIGNNYWRAYVDFTTVKDYYFASTNGPQIQVGWETGALNTSTYTNFTYDSPNYSSAHEYKDTSGVWHNWSSGSTYYDSQLNNFSQMPNVSFGTTSGTTDYSKGTYTHP